MNWIFLAFIIASIVWIILLRNEGGSKGRTREGFLKELTKFVDGSLERVENRENSFRISFTFEGESFIYEDIEGKGFRDKVYRTFLKIETPSKGTLSFSERKRSGEPKAERRILPDETPEQYKEKIKVNIPNELKDSFNVYTNNPVWANELFENKKIVDILLGFKSFDVRGYPFMALEIVRGTIILEFHPSGSMHPRPLAFHNNLQSLEKYLESLLIIANALKQ